jgi:hypothetical protein
LGGYCEWDCFPDFFLSLLLVYIKDIVDFVYWEPIHIAPLAHACNPSYSGGRDQEAHGLKPALSKSFLRPYLEKTHNKKGLVEGW